MISVSGLIQFNERIPEVNGVLFLSPPLQALNVIQHNLVYKLAGISRMRKPLIILKHPHWLTISDLRQILIVVVDIQMDIFACICLANDVLAILCTNRHNGTDGH